MPKVIILHHELDWNEEELCRQFNAQGIDAALADIRLITAQDILQDAPDLVINRVYASNGQKNYQIIARTIDLLKNLEAHGLLCVNNSESSALDYNKYEAYVRMRSHGVPTPETLLVERADENDMRRLEDFAEKYDFPLVIKSNIGGKGVGLRRAESLQELQGHVKEMLQFPHKHLYPAGLVVQEFIYPIRQHDARVAILEDDFLLSYGRTLISSGQEAAWIASCSNGSQLMDYESAPEEIEIARRASQAIGARFNEVDMGFGPNGPVIIENNTIPNYGDDEMPRIQQVVKAIIARYIQRRPEISA